MIEGRAIQSVYRALAGVWPLAHAALLRLRDGVGRWIRRARARRIGLAAVLVATAIPLLFASLRLAPAQASELALCLALSGLIAVGLGYGAQRLVEAAPPANLPVRLGVPVLLVALVIALVVALPLSVMARTHEDRQLLLPLLALGIAISLFVALPVVERLAQALACLELAAVRIAAGEYHLRLVQENSSGAQAFPRLACSIDRLASDIQDAHQGKRAAEAQGRQVISALSHDLRTPLCSILAVLEALSDGVVTDPETIQRYHRTLWAEAAHLSALVDGLLSLAQLEASPVAPRCERVPIEDIIWDALDATHERARHTHVHLSGQVDSAPLTVLVDGAQIARVLDNLLQNALRHTPAGGAILLRAAAQTSTKACADRRLEALVQVVDTGEGIPPGDLARIFEPTYRVEASRRRYVNVDGRAQYGCGAGLGLAIASRIIQAHGGRIWAVSPLPPDARALVTALDGALAPPASPGTLVCFTLPVLDEDAGNWP